MGFVRLAPAFAALLAPFLRGPHIVGMIDLGLLDQGIGGHEGHGVRIVGHVDVVPAQGAGEVVEAQGPHHLVRPACRPIPLLHPQEDAMLLGHWYLTQPGLPRAPLLDLVRWLTWLWPIETAVMLLPTGMGSVLTGTIPDGVRRGGKALLEWTRNAGEALALLQDLNDRYALDAHSRRLLDRFL